MCQLVLTRQMLFHQKQTLISLRHLPCQRELRAARAALCGCDLHINVKVCRQMSRSLRSKRKVAETPSGDNDGAHCERCCAENGVALAGGPLWFANAAAVALLWWWLLLLLPCITQLQADWEFAVESWGLFGCFYARGFASSALFFFTHRTLFMASSKTKVPGVTFPYRELWVILKCCLNNLAVMRTLEACLCGELFVFKGWT